MMRRAGMAIVGAIVAASTLAAAERATFLLTDGEKISGEVVFHTEARTNIRADKNEFNVKVSSGVEMPIPFAQVVAIDFSGGTPAATELEALPAAGGHLLTLRNGENRPGHLVDLIGGDTIRWRNASGEETNVPIAEARRIYLRTDRVRDVYNLPAAASQDTGGATVAPIPAPVPPAASRRGGGNTSTVTVRGAVPWTDTGLTVRRGQALRFDVSGGPIYINRTLMSGPAGAGGTRAGTPLESAQSGAVIGKVGNGEPFLIGTNNAEIRMGGTGKLMIGINDDLFDDNSGSFQVLITR